MAKQRSRHLALPDKSGDETGRDGALLPLRRPWVCPVCRTETDSPDRRGHIAIEGALYLAWIVPGLIYTFWRRARDPDRCPTCGYFPMVRMDAMAALAASSRSERRPCPWCAEDILPQAIVCKHCGRDVPRVAS